jgi:hypothetical protein
VNGKLVCESKATYGAASASGGGMSSGGMSSGAPVENHSHGGGMVRRDAPKEEWQGIVAMSRCNQPIPVKKGDAITVTSLYDLELHPM